MNRTRIIRNIILFLLALIAFDLFYLQVIRGGYFYRQSQNNATRVVPFDGPRGRILDRNGVVLAESVRSYQVSVIPQDVRDMKALFRFLAGVLGLEVDEVARRYERNRATKFAPALVSDGLTREQAIAIEENMLRYPGLFVAEKFTRRYPRGSSSAHVTGYVGKFNPDRLEVLEDYGFSTPEMTGYSGIEETYDARLRGQPGGREIEVNSRGRQVRLISEREPLAGVDIVLTIEQKMQRIAHEALAGHRGAAVVVDVANGEVLSLVSSPSFDPNVFVQPGKREGVAAYLQDSTAPMIDRAVSAQVPPGSVFKIPVAAGALEERKIRPGTIYDCPGYFDLGDRRFTFAHVYGRQNLIEAMAHSANEYFFNAGLLMGPEQMARYAKLFGLGERTGIDLPYEAAGRVPGRSRRSWFKGDTANMSIGQGETVATPVQVARMMAMIENKGRFVPLHIVKSVGAEALMPRITQRYTVLRPEVWGALKQSLRAVVQISNGTANELDIVGMFTYGKTGTAQSRAGKEDHAWFAGVTKGPKRTIAYCILLEYGGSSKNAVLVVREMLTQFLQEGLI
jgi:penicillin-binding protein 2